MKANKPKGLIPSPKGTRCGICARTNRATFRPDGANLAASLCRSCVEVMVGIVIVTDGLVRKRVVKELKTATKKAKVSVKEFDKKVLAREKKRH